MQLEVPEWVWQHIDSLLARVEETLSNPDVPRLPLDLNKWEVRDGELPPGDGWWLVQWAAVSHDEFDNGAPGAFTTCLWARKRKAAP